MTRGPAVDDGRGRHGVSEFVTGEAVALDLRTAAVPSRSVAAAIDLVLQVVLLAGLFLLATAASVDVSSAVGDTLGVLSLVTVLAGYPVVSETLLHGRTVGKMVMGLRVVRDDGGPVGFRQSLARGLSAGFLEKPGITFFTLPVVLSLLHPRGKRMGDLLAGTVVVQERGAAPGEQVAQMPPQLAGWAAALDLSGLSDTLALSVRQFVARQGQLTDSARESLGGRLVQSVAAVTSPPPPPGTPGWAFLAAVLAERRRRASARTAPGHPAASTPGSPVPAAPATAPAPAKPSAPAPATTPPQPPPPTATPARRGFAPPG